VITFADEHALARAAVRLGAPSVAGWSAAEQELAGKAAAQLPAGWPGERGISQVRAMIQAGGDPLGEAFCLLRTARARREQGQTFTPAPVVDSMVRWAAGVVTPARVVDPGTGSARFLVAAGRRWPGAVLAGVETDPLAAMIGRATLAAAGMAGAAAITLTDYRAIRLPNAAGPTLFLGNPPYVRHHQVTRQWKDWLRSAAARLGLPASGLAGLHAHFYLATALHAVPGDAGVLVTAAEWLDVNYGALIRELLLGPLGGEAIHVLDPAVPAFPDAAVTSAITCFRPGGGPRSLRLRRVPRLASLGALAGGVKVPAQVLRAAPRWGPLLGYWGGGRRLPAGLVELGELCRVHRGQVTGANRIWITASVPAGAHARGGRPGAGPGGVPVRFLFPAVTRARELFVAGEALTADAGLRRVIDLPADLSALEGEELALVRAFLAHAAAAGAADSYIARHRRPWWRVRLSEPAPILATYMARRPPAFVRNHAGVRHVNIAHGLYPRQPLPAAALDGLAAHLRRSVGTADGRTYAGGLTKFEPGEMERLPVPGPDLLAAALQSHRQLGIPQLP
jgi:hypothetical protein